MARARSAALVLFGSCGVLGWWAYLPAPLLLVCFVWLPGAVVVTLLDSRPVRSRPGAYAQGPGSFALECCLSLALLTPGVAPLFIFGAALGAAAYTLGCTYFVCGLVALFVTQQRTNTAVQCDDDPGRRWLAAGLSVAVLMPVVIAYAGGTVDDWWDLAFVRNYIESSELSFAEPILGSGETHPRFLWNSWITAQALSSYFSHTDPVLLQQLYVAPLVCLMSVSAVDYFAWALFRRMPGNAVAASLVVFPLWLFGTEQLPYFTRLHQDKFVVAFVCMPVLLGTVVRTLRERSAGNVAIVALTALAACSVHSLVFSIAVLGCWAMVAAWKPRPIRGEAYGLIAAVSWPLAYPVFQAWRLHSTFSNQGISLANADNPVVRAHLSLERLLWAGSPFSVVDPAAVFGFIALLGIPGLVFALRQRDQAWARCLVSLTLLPILLIFVPFVAAATGALFVPWMLYRLGWLVPVALLGGASFAWASGLPRPAQRAAACAALGVVAIALSVPVGLERGARGMHRRAFEKPHHPQGTTLQTYRFLKDSPLRGAVIAPPGFSELVSAMTGRANVALSERGTVVFSAAESIAYERLSARAEFYLESTPASRRASIASAYDVDHAVVRRGLVTSGSADRWLRRFSAEGFMLAHGQVSPSGGERFIDGLVSQGWRVVHDNADYVVLTFDGPLVPGRGQAAGTQPAGPGVGEAAAWIRSFGLSEHEANGFRTDDDVLASMTGYPRAHVEVVPVPYSIGQADEPIWVPAVAGWDDAPFEVSVSFALGRQCDVRGVEITPFIKSDARQVFLIEVGSRSVRRRGHDGVPISVRTDPGRVESMTVKIGSLVGASFGLGDIRVLGDGATCTPFASVSGVTGGYRAIPSSLDVSDFLDLSMSFPRNARSSLGLGRFLWKDGRREDAVAVTDQALVDDPGVANAWIEFGLMNDRSGLPLRARQCYERALALDRYNAWGRGCLAWSHVRDGDPLRALYHARLAARYDERYADAHTIAGMAKSSMGLSGSAITSFELAARLDPRRDWSYIELSRLHLDEGRPEEAQRALRQYLELVPDDERMTARLKALVAQETEGN